MILNAVIPVFVIIPAGSLVERLQMPPSRASGLLSACAVNIAIPCLTFHIMCTAPVERLMECAGGRACLAS